MLVYNEQSCESCESNKDFIVSDRLAWPRDDFFVCLSIRVQHQNFEFLGKSRVQEREEVTFSCTVATLSPNHSIGKMVSFK